MHVCPRAALDDGLLDVTVIGSLGAAELVRDVRVLYSDNIYSHPKTRHLRGRRVEARSEEKISIEVDGEPLGTLPLDLRVLPAAIRMLRRS
jgi:diacylglycerol kinase (ATP)